MDKLVVLDYSVGTVDIYNIDVSYDKIEDYLVNYLGYSLSNCEWMVGNMDITFYKEVLKDEHSGN